jgi:hypothetical protein
LLYEKYNIVKIIFINGECDPRVFEDAMRESKGTQECAKTCLPNCEETTYAYKVDTTELDAKVLCNDPTTWKVITINLLP